MELLKKAAFVEHYSQFVILCGCCGIIFSVSWTRCASWVLCGKFCQCQMKIVRFVTPRRACVTPRTKKTTRQQVNFKITILAKVQPCWCSAFHSSLFRDILFFMPLRCRQSFALLHEKILYRYTFHHYLICVSVTSMRNILLIFVTQN